MVPYAYGRQIVGSVCKSYEATPSHFTTSHGVPLGHSLQVQALTSWWTIWDIAERTPPRLLRGHSWAVFGLAWSPDGQWLASSGWDNAVRVWDMTTDACVQILRDPDYVDNNFQGIVWSPDGKFLANGSYLQGLQVWDMATRLRNLLDTTSSYALFVLTIL